jgi:glycosyltransferase involved in cell wall biosynthesis
MKTSVLIIAHNEEAHIAQCIESVLNQTIKAAEIVLIAHNCDDQTLMIAKRYPISVVEYNGPKGITYARIRGLDAVSGDIIICIDGDSIAQPNWIEELQKILTPSDVVLAGSWVKLHGTIFEYLATLFNKHMCIKTNPASWIWGASFAFKGKDIPYVREVLEKSITLSKELGLSRNPDDYWLALMMRTRGQLAVTNHTYVTPFSKETNSIQALRRNRENNRNSRIMRTWMTSR